MGATQHPEYPCVPLMLSGKFKKQMDLKLFCQSLSLVTDAGHPLQMWFGWMIWVMEKYCIVAGPMFVTTKRKAMSVSEIDTYSIWYYQPCRKDLVT